MANGTLASRIASTQAILPIPSSKANRVGSTVAVLPIPASKAGRIATTIAVLKHVEVVSFGSTMSRMSNSQAMFKNNSTTMYRDASQLGYIRKPNSSCPRICIIAVTFNRKYIKGRRDFHIS